MIDMRARIADRLETIEPYPIGRFQGRGIVVCAGGARMFLNAYVLVRILRETLRSALPIQLWHLGPQELSTVMRALIDDLDVEPVDAFYARSILRLSRMVGAILTPSGTRGSRRSSCSMRTRCRCEIPRSYSIGPNIRKQMHCSGRISSISSRITRFGDSAVLSRATARVLKAVRRLLQNSGTGAR